MLSAGSGSDGACMFSFLRNRQTVLQRDCVIWRSHPQRLRSSFPCPSRTCSVCTRSDFSRCRRCAGLRRRGLHLRFPAASDVDHLSVCFLAACPSSRVRGLLMLFYCFRIGLSGSLLLSLESCLYMLDRNPLSGTWLTNIFSQSGAWHFTVFTGAFAEWKFLIPKKSSLPIFFIYGLCPRRHDREVLA